MSRAANLMCLTCEQVLDNGRCTNELCPGYRPDPEEPTMISELDSSRDTMEHAGRRIDTLEAQLRDLREALGTEHRARLAAINQRGAYSEHIQASTAGRVGIWRDGGQCTVCALLGDKEAGK